MFWIWAFHLQNRTKLIQLYISLWFWIFFLFHSVITLLFFLVVLSMLPRNNFFYCWYWPHCSQFFFCLFTLCLYWGNRFYRVKLFAAIFFTGLNFCYIYYFSFLLAFFFLTWKIRRRENIKIFLTEICRKVLEREIKFPFKSLPKIDFKLARASLNIYGWFSLQSQFLVMIYKSRIFYHQ